MQPSNLEPVDLEFDESPAGHACADIGLYQSDLALLGYLLQDLRALVRQRSQSGPALTPYQTLTWEVHGLRRRTVVCDPAKLVCAEDVLIVGFFGDRRAGEASAELDTAELDVIGQFANYPGILSYSSIELVNDQWANLVVHTEVDDREAWRHSQIHIKAAEELAPLVYHSVRIHNGWIRRGPVGPEGPVIATTKYWDYDSTPTWHAQRTLPGGATETIGTPWLEP